MLQKYEAIAVWLQLSLPQWQVATPAATSPVVKQSGSLVEKVIIVRAEPRSQWRYAGINGIFLNDLYLLRG